MSVELARALAEAADGFVGYPHLAFFVCPYAPEQELYRGGFKVAGPYCGWHEVPELAKKEVCDGNAGFFGPYDLTLAPVVRGHRVSDVCLHIQDPDETLHVSLDHVDAMFFSTRAVEKFAQPYYERIFGPEFAAKVMTDFQNADVQVMTHFPWTEYVDGTMAINVPMVLRWGRSGGARLVPLHEGVPPVHVRRTDAFADA